MGDFRYLVLFLDNGVLDVPSFVVEYGVLDVQFGLLVVGCWMFMFVFVFEHGVFDFPFLCLSLGCWSFHCCFWI